MFARYVSSLAFLSVIGLSVAIPACTRQTQVGTNENSTARVRQFIDDTLSLELKGVRWRELMGDSSEQEYYSRFLWPPDVEPGWDQLFVADSFRITDIVPVTRSVDEYDRGDVKTRQETGFDVHLVLNDRVGFGRDSFHDVEPSQHTTFVVERNGRLLVADRARPPRLNSRAALQVLQRAPFDSGALDGLRKRLQQPGADAR